MTCLFGGVSAVTEESTGNPGNQMMNSSMFNDTVQLNAHDQNITSHMLTMNDISSEVGSVLPDTPDISSESSSESYVFVTKWGNFGSGDGQFSVPYGVVVDTSGNVYVTEIENNRIQKFNSSGTFLAKWGTQGSGDGQFQHPEGVTIDPSGNVYVADTHNHRIQKFSSTGSFLAKWGSNGSADGQFYYPTGVAFDSSGNVYVCDSWNNRIQKFNSSGSFITKWGSNGSANGQFTFPYGVTVDVTGNVYVVDTNNYRIQKFNSNGTFLAKWGSSGSGDGQFQNPFHGAVDSTGNVYVADRDNNRIQKFNSSGRFLATLGTQGSGDGELWNPFGVAVDSTGNVYVADTNNCRIQKFAQEILLAANFSANVTSGIAPLTVQFTDRSTGSPTSWNWSFGDGSLSSLQHPAHTYTTTGSYTVSLNATNAGGSNITTRIQYIAVTGSSATFYAVNTSISQGATVFIGEQGLNLTPAQNSFAAAAGYQPTMIGWWASSANIESSIPTAVVALTSPTNQSMMISYAAFGSHYGNWYVVNFATGYGSTIGGAFITVKDPQLALDIWDFSQNSAVGGVSVSGKSVVRGDLLGFKINTNMDTAINQPNLRSGGISGTDVNYWADIKVKTDQGNTFTALLNMYCQPIPVTHQVINSSSWSWGNSTTASGSWSTSALDRTGQFAYPPGTYTVTVESMLNGMRNNYKSGGADYTGKTVSAPQTVTIQSNSLVATVDKQSVTTGNSFAVTIEGRPRTVYHIWVSGTSSMSGGNGAQPPMIARYQAGVTTDTYLPSMPLPYINPSSFGNNNGGYLFQNSGSWGISGTVWADVAHGYYSYTHPSTMDILGNGTALYANVTLSGMGNRTVEFTTNNWTKPGVYKIRVEQNFGSEYMPVYKRAEVLVAVNDSMPQSYYTHQVSGVVGYDHSLSGTVYVQAFNQTPKTSIQPIYETTPGTDNRYNMPLTAELVWIFGFLDKNANHIADPDEPSGYAINEHGRHLADPIYLFSDRSDVDLTLSTRPDKPAGNGVNLTSNRGTINRADQFSLTVQGAPNTDYWVWVKDTQGFADAGGYNARPPTIVPYQAGILLDTTTSPTYGSQYTPQGSSVTVNELVPHGWLNGTEYYAKVRTNNNGIRVFEWTTANVTKAQAYTFRVENKSPTGTYSSDEATVNVRAGSMIITAACGNSAYFGDEIRLAGVNTETMTTYVFITGKNLAQYGAQIQSADPRYSMVIDGIPSTFQQVSVQDDHTWEWRWGTMCVALDPGFYTIYAVSNPRNAMPENQMYTLSANFTLELKKPFVTASVQPITYVKDDPEQFNPKPLHIRGVATGSPTVGIQCWILGENYAVTIQNGISYNTSYDYTLTPERLSSLAPGKYFVAVQHPMENNQFDIYRNGDMVFNKQLGRSINPIGTMIFSLLGAGSLKSSEAAEALVQAINDPNIDDTCVTLSFWIAENGTAPPVEDSIALSPGWNFISVPKKLAAGSNNATIFSDVNTEMHTIWIYNGSIRAWQGMAASDKVKVLDGIWIYSNRSMSVPLNFENSTANPQLPATKTLYPGWNSIGYSDVSPSSAHDTLVSIDPAWSTLIGFDASHGLYETSIIRGGSSTHADSRLLYPGKGYWVFVSTQAELSAIGA